MGVSRGTISRAFNDNPNHRINSRTKERVLRKAKEIGYFPNIGARAMLSGRSARWGLLLPNLQNPRQVELLDHLELEAQKRSTMLYLGLGRNNQAIEERIITNWSSGEVDGIIANSSTNAAVFEPLRKRGFPVVFLYWRPSPKFHVVDVETMNNYMALMERMFAAGHRRIGYAGVDFPRARMNPSFLAYSRVLRSHSLDVDESLVMLGTRDYTAGAEAWNRWRKHSQRPSAILCFNDIVACNLIESAKADGIRVPEDLSITGGDDIAEAANYHLTTIRIDPAQMAGNVFELLEKDGGQRGESRIVGSVIVDRGSIGPARSRKSTRKKVSSRVAE